MCSLAALCSLSLSLDASIYEISFWFASSHSLRHELKHSQRHDCTIQSCFLYHRMQETHKAEAGPWIYLCSPPKRPFQPWQSDTKRISSLHPLFWSQGNLCNALFCWGGLAAEDPLDCYSNLYFFMFYKPCSAQRSKQNALGDAEQLQNLWFFSGVYCSPIGAFDK